VAKRKQNVWRCALPGMIVAPFRKRLERCQNGNLLALPMNNLSFYRQQAKIETHEDK
jgi:hypothetical protein